MSYLYDIRIYMNTNMQDAGTCPMYGMIKQSAYVYAKMNIWHIGHEKTRD